MRKGRIRVKVGHPHTRRPKGRTKKKRIRGSDEENQEREAT